MSDWKRTGTPAHNNSNPRSAEDIPEYEANPQCDTCGGSGVIITAQPVRNWEGDCDDVEFIHEPCDCIFQNWSTKVDSNCKQCKGTGAVQERLFYQGEEYIQFHDCICLRYIKEDDNDEGKTH